MSQNLFPDLWMNPGGGQHQPQTSNYHSTSGVSAGGTIGVDTVGSVGGAQSDLDLNGFSQLGDLSGPGMYSYAANTFTGFPSHGGFFGHSYNSSLFTSSPWSQPPASTSSSYSTLNGAVSNPLSAPQQPQAQPAPSSTAIDPSLTMASGSSALHTNAYASSHSPHQAQYSPSQFTPYSHVSPSALSISTSFQQQQPQISQSQSPPSPAQPSPPMQHVRSPQQSTAPYAMHAPTPVPPSQFYGTASVPSVPTPPSASSSTQPTTSQLPPPPPTEYSPSNVQRENLRATVAPYLTEKSFTGARAVQTLVSAVAEFGITHVDVPLRLEILNKTLQNAGNNYYRAWMENISAMDITREWLKATVSSSAEGQVLETTMPLLTLLDRLPFTGPALKAAKVGKLVRRLSDSAMNAAVKDMASNLERKWKEKFIGGQQRDEPMEVDKSLKGQKRKSDREQDSTTSKSAPPAKKAALNGSSKSSSRATTVQKESSATTRAVGSAGSAGASGVKESKADASFFSKPKSKLPTFKKAPAIQAKKDDASSVSQPSAFNPFQEALKDMERNRRQSPTAQLPPASAAPASPVVSASLSKSGKPKKRVTWAPEGQLELVKVIERVVYSDDSVGSHPVHSNLRELDKGEGAALHLAADTFEELIDWVEPSPLDIPQEIVTPPRGGASEEKVNQERREETALAAMYLTLSQVPESPGEPANVLPLEQTDAQMRTMIPGGEIDAYVVTMRDQQQVVPPTSMQPLQPTVSDLVGQLGIPQQQPQPQPLVEALSHAGVDPNVLSDPNIISQIPQPQLHQLLQLLGSQTAVQPAAEPDTWGQQTPPTNGHLSTPSMPSHESPPPPYSNGEQSNRWDGGPPPRGSGWRGRGRGRGRGGKWRTPCSFFMQGRCKYGDQCDYSHEMSYG